MKKDDGTYDCNKWFCSNCYKLSNKLIRVIRVEPESWSYYYTEMRVLINNKEIIAARHDERPESICFYGGSNGYEPYQDEDNIEENIKNGFVDNNTINPTNLVEKIKMLSTFM